MRKVSDFSDFRSRARRRWAVRTRIPDEPSLADWAVESYCACGALGIGMAYSTEGSPVIKWFVWVGVLVLLNLLSYWFDWPFWVY